MVDGEQQQQQASMQSSMENPLGYGPGGQGHAVSEPIGGKDVG